MNEHYSAVLVDLREQRNRLEAEIREVDATIATIQRLAGSAPSSGDPRQWIGVPPPAPPPPTSQPSNHRFSKISVRWAALWHLAESEGFRKTGEIAIAILAGGYQSDAPRFGNVVSAVLSGMKAKEEVETSEDGGYRLTAGGRHTWELIRQGAKFRIATSSESRQLSVQ